MTTTAVIPVRMGSSRLPGKVMMPVLGKPLLGYLLDRLKRCSSLDELVIATSSGPEDDFVEAYCNSLSVLCFRGSEVDVLDRLLRALRWRGAVTGVLVFGDCPLIDPAIVTLSTDYFQANRGYDFVGNDLRTTYPSGMEVEVFSVDALADSARRCTDTDIREHGTLYIRTHPEIYKLHNLEAPQHWRRPDLMLEVDTKEDMEVVRNIIERFSEFDNFTLDEIIDFMDRNPELAMVNQNIPRRWKRFRNRQSGIF